MSPAPPPPFQFTLKQLVLLIAACSAVFALLFHWGVVGFVFCYVAASLIAMIWGAVRREGVIFLGGFAMLAFGFCIVNMGDGRQPARRAECTNNMRNILLAMLQYHDSQGEFPPAYIADANGKPMHSWRVLILPYLDQKVLYRTYRFDEPWDGPNNRKLHDIALKIYSCPSRDEKQPKTDTSYVVVVGPQTMWPGERSSKVAEITDGLSNTIMLVESHNSGIHWMEPRDLHVLQMPSVTNPQRGQGISSNHKGGANVGFADGSIRYVVNGVPAETIQAALTRSGKEPPPREPEQ